MPLSIVKPMLEGVFLKYYYDYHTCRTWYFDLPFDWPRYIDSESGSKSGLIEALAVNWFDFIRQTRTPSPVERSRSMLKDLPKLESYKTCPRGCRSRTRVSAWVWHDFESCRSFYTCECVAITQLSSPSKEALETLVVCQNQSLTSIRAGLRQLLPAEEAKPQNWNDFSIKTQVQQVLPLVTRHYTERNRTVIT